MFKTSKAKVVYLLWALLSGKLSFFISGVIACTILLHLNTYILETIISGGLAGLLLAVFLGMFKMIGKMTLAGLASVPVGFWSAFILAGGVDLLLSLIGVNTRNLNIYNIENIIGIIFMGIICGAIFGAIAYGRKSIWMFSAVCGMVSFLFGILVSFFNSGHPIKASFENLFAVLGPIDLNFLAIITSFGIGIGLSIGLFSMLKQKSTRKGSV